MTWQQHALYTSRDLPRLLRGRAGRTSVKRPFGVTVIGVLLLLQGLALIMAVATDVWLQVTQRGGGLLPAATVDLTGLTLNGWLSIAVVSALGLFSVAAGIGVWRLRPWAWLVAMALEGWTLATLLLDYFSRGRSSYLSMLLGAIIVFYLNTRTVRETFDLARRRESAG